MRAIRRLLRREEGSALLAAIVLLGVMVGLGLAVHAQADNESRQSGNERVAESALSVAEAALRAQVAPLAANYPYLPSAAHPVQCASNLAADDRCPSPQNFASYAGGDFDDRCGTSAPVQWTTTVRDNDNDASSANGTAQTYTSAVQGYARYDANGDGTLWLRADGRAGCRTRSIVTMVRAQEQQLLYPRSVIVANGFRTTNNGNKVIVDTQGDAPQAAAVALRCAGFSTPAQCAQYEANKGQIQPPTVQTFAGDAAPSPLIQEPELSAIRALARANQTYYGPGQCPPSLTGEAVWVHSLAGCSVSEHANSIASPGFLVVECGTFDIGGNDEFTGVLYMRNGSGGNCPQINGYVVNLGGTSLIRGSVAVDGPGSISAGASKANVIFDSRAQSLVKGLMSAAAVPNTWRELPRGQ